MPLHLPTLLTRTGSAIVFGALMLAALLGPAWVFGAVFLGVHILALREYFALVAGFLPPVNKGLQVAAQLVGGLFVAIAITGLLPVSPGIKGPLLISGILLMLLYPVCMLLAAALSQKSSFSAGITAVGGNLYITLPIIALFIMRAYNNFPVLGNYNLPLLLLVFIWCNDSFAYLSGSLIGKTPLTAISPKKTWEGTAGGALLTVGIAFLYSYFWGTYPFWLTIGFALCAAIPGTLGDLLESRMKRLAGVKDSGKLMPGHGGALDRFDSLLVAAPFALVYFCITSIILR
jgi:phosphatidate cytidylyltransferase